ncbi:MAG: Ig-like domain-containing protein, partial [Candidatus Dormibacteria bacterium]
NTVTLSASGLPADATGTVSFTDQDGNALCTSGQIGAGTGSCTTAALPAGSYSPVTATYPGDSNYLGSTATTEIGITRAATSFTASADPTSATHGNTVLLSVIGLPGDATGTVIFTDQDGIALCTSGQIGDGSASCTTAALPAGSYAPVTATYPGDGNYLGSTATTEFAVAQAATSFTASANPAGTSFGNTVTLSASGLPADATGTVSFTDQDGNALCTSGPIVAGSASCRTVKLPAGDYSAVTATYSGDANYLGSTALTSFTVTADPVFEVVTSGSSTSIRAGGSYTLSSSVTLDTSGGPAYQDPTLTEQLPAGETFTQDAPSSWRCSLGKADAELSCTSTAALPIAPGTSLGSIPWTVQVTETASGTLVTNASLADPGDQATPAADSTSLTVTAATAAPTPDTGALGGPSSRLMLPGSVISAVGILLLLWRRRRPLADSDSVSGLTD